MVVEIRRDTRVCVSWVVESPAVLHKQPERMRVVTNVCYVLEGIQNTYQPIPAVYYL